MNNSRSVYEQGFLTIKGFSITYLAVISIFILEGGHQKTSDLFNIFFPVISLSIIDLLNSTRYRVFGYKNRDSSGSILCFSIKFSGFILSFLFYLAIAYSAIEINNISSLKSSKELDCEYGRNALHHTITSQPDIDEMIIASYILPDFIERYPDHIVLQYIQNELDCDDIERVRGDVNFFISSLKNKRRLEGN
jgi:magnesium-transporting ATPase (P-type)